MSTVSQNTDDDVARLHKRLAREQSARREAERVLEEKARDLFMARIEVERLHAQERESVARLRSVLNGMPIGVLTTDEHGVVDGINETAMSYFTVRPEDAKGRHIGLFIPAFHASSDENEVRKISETTSDHLYARRSTGAEFSCEITISKFAADDGEVYIWMVRDTTERIEAEQRKKELEGELRQAHRLESLGTMAGGIAHELNTPIQFVSDNMKFLSGAFSDLHKAIERFRALVAPEIAGQIAAENDLEFLAAEIPTAIEQSREGLARVAEIVLAIKRFSHPSGDVKESNDFNQIVATTVTVSKNQWKYIADMELDLDPKLPPVKSNAGELNQALINLIVNAAHAIEDKGDKAHKGKITITTRLVGGAVACSVSDTGIGIPSKDRDKIFDLFFTTKEPGRGTGQGLSLVHNIIKDHGGRITVDSEVGRGTRVIFVIPLEASAVAAMKAA